jgi:hypothetical protein
MLSAPRSPWLSAAGGAAVAYVFVHVFPGLCAGQETVARAGWAWEGLLDRHVFLIALAGLLAGALSMGAGEYVSVRSQRELLEASTPDPQARAVLPQLDVNANELALVYRARGMAEADAVDGEGELRKSEKFDDGQRIAADATDGDDAETAALRGDHEPAENDTSVEHTGD